MSISPISLTIGIDFGTSFTKVCVCDINNKERSWVVTFSQGRVNIEEALLPAKIAICNDGRLLAGLTKSEWMKQPATFQVAVDYIKMRLANVDLVEEEQEYPSDSLQSYQGIDLNTPESLENLCAYYLSSVIAKTKAWVQQNNADLVMNQEISWSANIGVPVKYCDSHAIKRFTKVLKLAWLLSESYPQSFSELWDRMTQLRHTISYENIPCFAIPEIAAAVYSYTVSRQAKAGVYTFFDIGSGTMEGATFRFSRENGIRNVDFYSGEVDPLGVNALAKWVNSKVSGTEAQVEADLTQSKQSLLQQIAALSERIADERLTRGEHISNKHRVTKEAVTRALRSNTSNDDQRLLHLILGQGAIQKQVAKVVMTCMEKAPEDFRKSSNLRIFLGGGGKDAEYYRDTIETTYFALSHNRADIPPYNIQELPFPADFDMSGINHNYFHRFAIAYGLSIPKEEGNELRLPSLFPIIPQHIPQPIIPDNGRYPDDNSSM